MRRWRGQREGDDVKEMVDDIVYETGNKLDEVIDKMTGALHGE